MILKALQIAVKIANIWAALSALYRKWRPEKMDQPAGTSEIHRKPPTIWSRSPNFSYRNGVKITRIVMHYTTSDNVQGTLGWFANPASRVSAHYVISRQGVIHQCVEDGNKAWHARRANSDSIGIEFCAGIGKRMTKEQDQVGVDLIKYLMDEYWIKPDDIVGHRFLNGGTECPGNLFGDDSYSEEQLRRWVDFNFKEKPKKVALS